MCIDREKELYSQIEELRSEVERLRGQLQEAVNWLEGLNGLFQAARAGPRGEEEW